MKTMCSVYICSIFGHTSIYIYTHVTYVRICIYKYTFPASSQTPCKQAVCGTHTWGYSPTTVTVKQQAVHVFSSVSFISIFTITCIAGGIYRICIHMYSFHGVHLKVEAALQLVSIHSWLSQRSMGMR